MLGKAWFVSHSSAYRYNVDSDQILLSQLAGTWTEVDEIDFLQNTEAFREVEESLWS